MVPADAWATLLDYDNGLAGPWVAAYVAFLFASTVVCRRTCGDAPVAGSPRWTFGCALAAQCAVFPALTAAVVAHDGVAGLGACAATDADVAAGFVYAVYWAKDFAAPMSSLMALHHVACFVGLGVAFGVLECGRGLWLVAVCLFEVGSACMNACELWPRRRATVALYAVGMAASNAAGLAATYRALAAGPCAGVVRVAGLALTAVVAYFRQAQANDYYARGWDDGDRGGRRAD